MTRKFNHALEMGLKLYQILFYVTQQLASCLTIFSIRFTYMIFICPSKYAR
uniref:Uncharacterized protein n=1 Tax=Rhizophora mucronata TaxID=61149 RepID=A0A2P2PWV2_RHIMU